MNPRRLPLLMLVALGAAPLFGQVYGPVQNPPPVGFGGGSSGNSGAFMTMDDYPPDSLMRHEQGTVVVSYDIEADGSVSNCVVKSSSGFPSLDQASCALILKRARYKPATDESGRPVRSREPGKRISWRIPR